MARIAGGAQSRLAGQVVRFLDGTEKLSNWAASFSYHENAKGECVLTVEFNVSADDLEEKETAK